MKGVKKRPSAAASGVEESVKKRPAAAAFDVEESVKKRPSAVTFDVEERPKKTPAGGQTKPGTIHYKGARIYTSDLKQGYRVMMPGEKKVDVLFKWALHPNKEACLAAIKRVVDGK